MDKEQVAIERLKVALETSFAVYGLPLVVTTSDGNDNESKIKMERTSIKMRKEAEVSSKLFP